VGPHYWKIVSIPDGKYFYRCGLCGAERKRLSTMAMRTALSCPNSEPKSHEDLGESTTGLDERESPAADPAANPPSLGNLGVPDDKRDFHRTIGGQPGISAESGPSQQDS
jgi:hypothetical protein